MNKSGFMYATSRLRIPPLYNARKPKNEREIMMQKLTSCAAVAAAMDPSYVAALEEEKKKILVFERELPLSLHLVTQVIDSCRRQLEEKEKGITTELGPVLEEFMPLRPSKSPSSNQNDQERNFNSTGGGVLDDKKPVDWLRSAQLWKQPDLPTEDVNRRPTAGRVIGTGGAFHPFEKEKNVEGEGGDVVVAAASSTTAETRGGEEKEKESLPLQRKARRSWSPELHRRFLHALQQLGGSQAATPKQIKELMKVDGLTNDEVKSHLQKYRLHTRRPTSGAVQSNGASNAQNPQIVLVGGLWMPPPECAASAAVRPTTDATASPLNRINSPAAAGSHPLQKNAQQSKRSPTGPLNSGGRCSGDDRSEDGERTNTDSSATASSSQTTTGSHSDQR